MIDSHIFHLSAGSVNNMRDSGVFLVFLCFRGVYLGFNFFRISCDIFAIECRNFLVDEAVVKQGIPFSTF